MEKQLLEQLSEHPNAVMAPDDSVSTVGRVEIKTNDGVTEMHQYFGDWTYHQPDVTVDLVMPDLSVFESMFEDIVANNMQGACKKAETLKSELCDVKVSKKNTVTGRQADVEYPFLNMLKAIGIDFVLLNPTKGTLRRIQKIFFDCKTVYVVKNGDNMAEYMNMLDAHNESGWPIVATTMEELPPNKNYYTGFLFAQFDGINQMGFEINPRNMVLTHKGQYTISSTNLGDEVSLVRDSSFVYEEHYEYAPSYYRYCSDTIEAKFKTQAGYIHHGYPLMYNVVSTFKLPFTYPTKVKNDIFNIVGITSRDGLLSSPYEDQRYNIPMHSGAWLDNVLYVQYENVALPGEFSKTPYMQKITPYDIHRNHVMVAIDNDLVRQAVTSNGYVDKNVFYPVEIKETYNIFYYYEIGGRVIQSDVPRSYMSLLQQVYPGLGHVVLRKGRIPIYDGNYSHSFFISYRVEAVMKNSQLLEYMVQNYDYNDSFYFFKRKNPVKSRPIISHIMRNVPKIDNLVRKFNNNYYQNGKLVEYLELKEGVWYKNNNVVYPLCFNLVRAGEGFMRFGDGRYLPYNDTTTNIINWATHINKAYHYQPFSSNEMRVKKDAIEYDDVAYYEEN